MVYKLTAVLTLGPLLQGMEAADWTGIAVCVRLVEGEGGGELRQLAFFGGSLSWHLGGHQAVARAGGLQVPAAEAVPPPSLGCSLLSSHPHVSFQPGAPEGIDTTVLIPATRGHPRHTDFCCSGDPWKPSREGKKPGPKRNWNAAHSGAR